MVCCLDSGPILCKQNVKEWLAVEKIRVKQAQQREQVAICSVARDTFSLDKTEPSFDVSDAAFRM